MRPPPPNLPPVAARFWRYVQIDTQADPLSRTTPSTAKQLDLAVLLRDELAALGLPDVAMDAYGYVYATLPGTLPPEADAPVLGLVAHVDTSPDAPGGPVRPVLHPHYQGQVLALPGDPSVTLDPARQPALLDHLGHDLLTSDGTTLLGSDDKAGVAVIMQAVEDLRDDPRPRPTLRVLFTIDEEIGRGVDHLDLTTFGATVAYTVDGGAVGSIEAETFNAAAATLRIYGRNVHPGYAKGSLVNALQILADAIAALPADERPETTSDRQGYYFAHTIPHAEPAYAEVHLLLRDFDDAGMERRKAFLAALASDLEGRYPGSRVQVEIRDQYRNMQRYIEAKEPRAVPFALEAAQAIGLTPRLHAIRGGTDGARLSERGLPTPNVFTGGFDFHSRFEWNTVQNLETTLAYVKALVHRWAAT